MSSKQQNICKFIPSAEIDTDINVLNLVYEANWHQETEITRNSYQLCLVLSGSASFVTCGHHFELHEGDLFFIFSTKPFCLLNKSNLTFCYIAFIGARVHPLLDRLKIHREHPVYHGYQELIPFWKQSIERAKDYNIDLVAHSVLYHTLSYIATDLYQKTIQDKNPELITEVKRYIDEHFNNPALHLNSIAAKFGYHPKYISARFKRTLFINITEYITNCRMQYAQELMAHGAFSVSQISAMCGFKDPLYFSRIYKKTFGISPSSQLKMKDIKES